MKTLSFDDLVLGKMYKAVPSKAWESKTKKAIYADQKALDHYIGLIYPSEIFVLLGYSTDGRWLQVLAGEGHMGWVRNNIDIKPVVSNEA